MSKEPKYQNKKPKYKNIKMLGYSLMKIFCNSAEGSTSYSVHHGDTLAVEQPYNQSYTQPNGEVKNALGQLFYIICFLHILNVKNYFDLDRGIIQYFIVPQRLLHAKR